MLPGDVSGASGQLKNPHARRGGEHRGVTLKVQVTKGRSLGDISNHQGFIQGLRIRVERQHIDEQPLPGWCWACPTVELQDLEVGQRAAFLLITFCIVPEVMKSMVRHRHVHSLPLSPHRPHLQG